MEIMVVVIIIALLAGIAIPSMLTARKFSNEANAKTVLMTISTACENYAASNNGYYPTDIANLTNATPPYLTNTTGLNSSPLGVSYGYNISCEFNDTSYNCSATPQTCNSTGTKTYTVINGGNLTSGACE